ncbi:MAG TPA: hypothetical protein VGX23_35250 [Actinocrinis sp.]|nr:hypothetical protein [Actinocrinis sp.]
MRYLTSSLFAEGPSDTLFLADLLTRQVRELLWAGDQAETDRVQVEGCHTVDSRERLQSEILEVAQTSNIIFIHNDHREAKKIEALRSALDGRLPRRTRLVPIVPRAETDAWCLIDAAAFRANRGAECSLLPSRPADVERIADPKAVLAKVVGTRRANDALELLGANVSLKRLAEVPAYRLFLDDLTTALKELNFS